MSYILEALKKSKEERQGEGAPHLHIVHGVPTYKRRSKMFGRTGMLLCGMGIVFVGGGLIFLNLPEKKIDKVVEAGQSISLRQIEIRSQFFELMDDSVVVEDSLGLTTLPVVQQELPKIIRISKSGSKKVVLKASGDDAPQSLGEYQEILYRRDLPQNIQKELPELVFAGHTYADDPGRRMIIVNNIILREGDSIDADTKLLNIIWEGVVLDYRGVVFKQRTH